jgi:two-component system phosphate regulon sensor histidine kinase PhoR
MTRIGLRARLFLISVGLIALSLIPAHAFLTSRVEAILTGRIREDLAVRASLIAAEAAEFKPESAEPWRWDALADRMAMEARARVTIISPEGAVMGDSDLDRDQILAAENHLTRPEVAKSLAGDDGSDMRFSKTLGRRMLYVAVPLRHHGRLAGVVQTALPLEAVDEALAQLRQVIAIGLLLALAAAAAMSSFAAHLVSAPFRRLAETAREIARGGAPAVRTRAPTEFLVIGQSLDEMAANLSRAMTDLQAERDRLGALLADMQEGILLVGGDGRVDLVNPAFHKLFRIEADATGRTVAEATGSPELCALVDQARGGVRTQGELQLAVPSRRLLVRAAPQTFESGAVLAVVVDVTDVRRLEATRRDFVANASHELRTPVATIRGAVETLQGEAAEDPAAATRFVAIIGRNAERLGRLVEDLLDLSRLESGEFKPALEPIEITGPALRVAALFREKAEARRIAIEVLPRPGEQVVVADSRALEQILSNLVDNAIKYGRDDGRVRIGAERHGDRISLWVKDDGPGIDPAHLPRLFERFYRVDAGRSRELGGTGLGLAIVKHLAEAMGGSVTVSSLPGAGARFDVYLRRDNGT